MSIGEICTREVVIAEKKSSIAEIAQLMREYHVGDVIVVERRGDKTIPIGIITDRDIVVKLIAQKVDIDSVTTGDVMTFDLISVKEEDDIWTTLQQMRGKGIRRLPVVDKNGSLAGIVTLDDLIELLAEELTQLARISESSQNRERHKLE